MSFPDNHTITAMRRFQTQYSSVLKNPTLQEAEHEVYTANTVILQLNYAPMPSDQEVIQQTVNWVRDVVVGLNLCPFASPVVKQQSLRYVVERSPDAADCLDHLLEELQRLDEDPSIETTLIILPDSFPDFNDYLGLVEAAEWLIKRRELEGIFQVASFHPDYTFGDSEENDAADYTNRSPYPMLHLLREESIEKALENFKDPDSIPERNVRFTREKGVEYMKMLRDGCLKL